LITRLVDDAAVPTDTFCALGLIKTQDIEFAPKNGHDREL
jgi:hypothetical protein